MDRNELAMLQALPLEIKILKSQQRIREWYQYFGGDVYASLSGGLDSTVMLDLIRKVYPEVPAVFIDTGLEFPEVRKHALSFDPTVIHPQMRFDEVIKKHGFPVVSKETSQYIREARTTKSEKLLWVRLHGRPGKVPGRIFGMISKKWQFLIDAPFLISDKCCNELKKKPIALYEKQTGRKAFVGIKSSDGMNRHRAVLHRGGCNAFIGKQQSWPLSFWNDQDILHYIRNEQLPYPAVYGEIRETDLFGTLETTGEKRTGCAFCMFGCHMDKVNRFQRMKKTHPALWNYCMGPLGLAPVLDFMGIAKE